MKIFLIGFMGCGKTTLGRKLASKLGHEGIDLDHKIEEKTGQTVAEYFAAHGEPAFRNMESKLLKEFPYPEHCIVATGGGTPCYFDNMDWMNKNGLTIYIEMSAVALAKRLEKGKAKRPLLKDLSPGAIVTFIENKLQEREIYYKQAALIVNGINLTADELLQQLP